MLLQLGLTLLFLLVVALADALERGYLRQLGREVIQITRDHPLLVAGCVSGAALALWALPP